MNLRNKLAFFIALNSYVELITRGTSPLSLPKAIADSLSYVKAFGGTEQETETIIKTATAQGKCVQRNLPEGYTQLEYIQTTGTQYIDTGVKADEDYDVEITFTTPSALSNGSLFGNQNSDVLLYLSSNNFLVYNNNANKGSLTPTLSADTTYSTKLSVVGTSATISGDFTSSFSELTISGTRNILLGANHSSGGTVVDFGKFKYNSVKITKGGTLVRNFVPCKNSSNVIGMYDIANDVFYQNAGTGDFIAGSDAVPTPTAPIDIMCNNGVLKARHQSGLPLGYTLLDYIEKTSSDQYIDTGIKFASEKGKVQVTASFTGTNGGMFGAQNGANNTSALLIYSNAAYFGSIGLPNTNLFGTTMGTATLEANNGNYTITNSAGTVFNGTYTGSIQSINSWYIGAMKSGNSINGTSAGKIANVKLWDNDVLVFNGIPAQHDTDVGMYDLVSGQFFTNAGTGDFTAGSAVSDPVEIYTVGTQETVTDNIGNVATCERLLQVGTYTDTQEILSGAVTRKVGVKVLDGTENWTNGTPPHVFTVDNPFTNLASLTNNYVGYSNCYSIVSVSAGIQAQLNNNQCGWNTTQVFCVRDDRFSDYTDFKQYLAQQYAAGTPVIVIYPLATATTESVAGQNLRKQPLTIAGSLPNLLVNTTTTDAVPTPDYPQNIVCNNGVLKWDSVNQTVYADGTVETIAIVGVNLFNKNAKDTNNGYVQNAYVSGTGEILPESIYDVSEYIQVKPSTNYFWCINGIPNSMTQHGNFPRVGFYNANKELISVSNVINQGTAPTTTPAGCKYVRVTIYHNQVDTEMLIEGSTYPTEYVPYGSTATVQDLLSIGNYTDEQEVISGAVTRKVGVKVLDGTESWLVWDSGANYTYRAQDIVERAHSTLLMCSHFQNTNGAISSMPLNSVSHPEDARFFYIRTEYSSVTELQQYLAQQYAAGTPVMVIYPLATPTTETVTGQAMETAEGDNTAEITQASLSGLELEAKYKKRK